MNATSTPKKPGSLLRRALVGVSVVGGLAVGVLVGTPAPAQAGSSGGSTPKTYPFYCRGGGGMMVKQGLNYDSAFVNFHFEKGTRGVKVGGVVKVSRLAPGTCSWNGRGMSAEEEPILDTWGSDKPNAIAVFANMATCARDEHCVFQGYAYRNREEGNRMRLVESLRTTFWHLP